MKRILKYLLISVLVLLNVYTVVDLFATNISNTPSCWKNFPDLYEGCAYCLCDPGDLYPWCVDNDCWSFGWDAPPYKDMGYCWEEVKDTYCLEQPDTKHWFSCDRSQNCITGTKY